MTRGVNPGERGEILQDSKSELRFASGCTRIDLVYPKKQSRICCQGQSDELSLFLGRTPNAKSSLQMSKH